MDINKLRGRLTMPVQMGMDNQMKELIEKWGADGVRNSDGTVLPESVKELELDIYATVCLIRADNEWAKANTDKIQQKYLLSNAVIADEEIVNIKLLEGIFKQQFSIDTQHDPKIWWEVIDRTTGKTISPNNWDFVDESGMVTIRNVDAWHKYTVTFLTYQIWEPVSILNYISNGWEGDHLMPIDPRHPETRERILLNLEEWLQNHNEVAVVRLTSLFYFFNKILDENHQRRFYDWTGYADTVSPLAILEFEKEYGYRPRPENFVTNGNYNSPANVPSKIYLDWIDFQQRFVIGFGRQIVELIHKAGKKASLFFCDHWIGTEPYGPYMKEMNIDQIVAPVGTGTDFRRISDVPGSLIRSSRFFPYFFPSFIAGASGGPAKESREHWMKIRRAHLRRPIDRIEYGGYPKAILEYPELIDHIGKVCDEFREIVDKSQGKASVAAPFTVAILNAWGALRSWMNVPFWYDKFMKEEYTECLAGMPFDIKFISFEDIIERGIDKDIGVIINAGMAETAWSGGQNWADPRVVATVRQWVYNGGGLLGIQDPTAHWFNGSLYQMNDILGVQKEIGLTTGLEPKKAKQTPDHFIAGDGIPCLGIDKSWVYPCSEDTEIIAHKDGHVLATAHKYGKGRSVYFAGLPFGSETTRLLQRGLIWAASREQELLNWYSSNAFVEVAAYPSTGNVAVINNSTIRQTSSIWKDSKRCIHVELQPEQLLWLQDQDFNG